MRLQDNKILVVRRHNKVVYQDGERIVKVFDSTKPASDVFNEALNLARVAASGLRVPKVLEVSQIKDGSWALATEYIPGTTMRSLMRGASPDDLYGLFERFVDLQVEVQRTSAPWLLTAQGEKLAAMIAKLKDIDATIRYDLQMRAAHMRYCLSICHGDFNPSNVIVGDDGRLYVCDWAHVTRGLPEADAALTYILLKMYHEGQAEIYLDIYSRKAEAPKHKVLYWVPVAAAAELSRGRKDSLEYLTAIVNSTTDYD